MKFVHKKKTENKINKLLNSLCTTKNYHKFNNNYLDI